MSLSDDPVTSPHRTASPASQPFFDIQTASPSVGLESDSISLRVGHLDATSEKHPKGRRKRTAAKDKSVLEAAYNSNPKPDKAARLDIVQRVSLNEKEVQIWFQNRRQNDRRKSRPLSPQEIAALRTNGLQLLSSDPVTSSSQADDSTSPRTEAFPSSALKSNTCVTQSVTASHLLDKASGHSGHSTRRIRSPGNSGDGSNGHTPLLVHDSPLATYDSSATLSSARTHASHRSDPEMPFSCSFSTPDTNHGTVRLDPLFTPSPASMPGRSIMSTSRSHVRLSLSLEGKAELISHPNSPPRTQPEESSSPLPRPRMLRRSQSAAAHVTLPPITALTGDLPPRLRKGRSRDAHVWEQCCDSDTRDELTTQAENESSGSAVAAISLLRSTSSVLQSNGLKRNAAPVKWKSLEGKRPRLSRTNSSYAVMQQGEKSPSPISPVLKPADMPPITRSPSGDSDKENWSPAGERNPRYGPQQSSLRRALGLGSPGLGDMPRQGRAVRDHHAPWLMHRSKETTTPQSSHTRAKGSDLNIFEDAETRTARRESDEAEIFMGGEVSPGKKGDLDCIAGLLSLSQGNWR